MMWYRLVLPLIEFWVEVPLLGGGSSLGGGLLVRQQEEGNVRVSAVLGAGCQGSEGVQTSQYTMVPTVPEQKCAESARPVIYKPAGVNGDEKPAFLCGVADGKLNLSCCVGVIVDAEDKSVYSHHDVLEHKEQT